MSKPGAQVVNTAEWELFGELDAAIRPSSPPLNGVPDLKSGFTETQVAQRTLQESQHILRYRKTFLPLLKK